ncbi:GroES-like protein [Delitschia confertaspora ATCC 74209]|uniref:GroES-like protein n=1 Tax=Delitschia confertaspora ATCC 74209 TaxID=1513339 RepID=A0A9P4N0U1_9PLEO|nr:GroES-like protein [Delitschia confertaspora ATCC 74209]
MPSFTVYKGSKDGSIQKSQTTKGDLKNDEVLIRVTASGLCGTDEHYRTSDMVLGHEGAGVIEAVGPAVRSLKKGDRVGWGYEHDCCGECTYCLSGRETFCPERKMYGYADLDQGSFATHAVWREAFVFKLPEGLTDKEAAPLMCGGATVFNALRMYNIAPTSRVGVMGVGGLGHLAIQFASKMGCDVVVFSGTESKKEEAMKLGASEFVAMKGKKELDIGRKLDVLLVTMSAQPDWSLILPVMAGDSIIFPLSVSGGDFTIPYTPLLLQGIRVQGSIVAPRNIHKQMLQFAALHQIKPVIMEFPLNQEGITKAMTTLNEGNMRYRGVLVPEN